MLINEDLKKLDVDNNRVVSRECDYREFKENFDHKKIWEYAKIMISFANKKGGIIFYGVQEYFDPEVDFEVGEIKISEKKLNYILVFSSKNKPIICKKEKRIRQEGKKDGGQGSEETALRLGAIYYRYSSSSTEIKYSELKDIIDQKVKEVFSSLIDNIKLTKEIGYNNVAMIGLEDLKNNNKKVPVYMTKESVKNINWIKKGKFSEDRDASKAFYVTHEVKIMNGLKVYHNPSDDYPIIKKDLLKNTDIHAVYLNKILENVGILKNGKCDERYCTKVPHGKNMLYKFNTNAQEKILKEYPLDLPNRKNLIKNLKNKND